VAIKNKEFLIYTKIVSKKNFLMITFRTSLKHTNGDILRNTVISLSHILNSDKFLSSDIIV